LSRGGMDRCGGEKNRKKGFDNRLRRHTRSPLELAPGDPGLPARYTACCTSRKGVGVSPAMQHERERSRPKYRPVGNSGGQKRAPATQRVDLHGTECRLPGRWMKTFHEIWRSMESEGDES